MIARACIVVCVATLGCASAPVSGSAPATSHPASVSGDETVNIRLAEEPDAMNSVINAPPAKVWAAMPLVYKQLEP